MPGHVLHVGASVSCPHAGQATITPSNLRVKVSGQFVAVVSDQTTVAGCPFQVPAGTTTKPQPCVTVRWTVPALRVKAMGKPILLEDSAGVCLSAEQIPQGAPTAGPTQIRVKAT